MKSMALLVGFIYLVVLLPLPAAAEEPRAFSDPLHATAAESFVLPPQEEGKLTIPSVVSKPWYKNEWLLIIVMGVVAGAAAAQVEQAKQEKVEPVIQ